MKSIKKEIEKIELENEQLKQELARESRQARMTQLTSSAQNVELERLRKEADSYLRKIEAEKKKIEELEAKISTATGDPHAVRENHRMLTKQIKLLENRLAKALEKFNEQLAKNKKIRNEIDEYRKERVVYDGIYKKLEKELHAKKKEMAAIIENAKESYAKRDKAKNELNNLKKIVHKEKVEFEREWAELGQLMEEDKLLKQIPQKKIPKKSEPKKVEIIQKKEETKKSTLTNQQVETYEDTFQQILKQTGVSSMTELIDLFQSIEEKNFSLFNSINDINSDIEITELNIAETKLEIEKYKGQGVSTDTQRKKILKELEDKLARTEGKADEYEAKQQAAQKVINQLKTGIHSIFSRLGCASSFEEMLGNQGVTEANMMQYLEIIEQRTTDILQTYAASQAAASARADLSSTSPLDHGVVQPAAPRLSVQPPTLDDFSSGDDSDQDDDERPLTREELQRKTLRFGLQQSSSSAKKKILKPP